MKRIFIVGIARSGTTLLQSILGSHPDVRVFPESHIFDRTLHKHPLARRIIGVYRGRDEVVREFLDQVSAEDLHLRYDQTRWSLRSWTAHVFSRLDAVSARSGHRIWVEKTPLHLHYAAMLTDFFPEVKVIHIVRKPLANIGALLEVSRRYPETFAQGTIDLAIRRYLREIQISNQLGPAMNHRIVRYEDLVRQPEQEVRALCTFLELGYSDEMMAFRETADEVSTSSEVWKANNQRGIFHADKTRQRLTDAERGLIEQSMRHIPQAYDQIWTPDEACTA